LTVAGTPCGLPVGYKTDAPSDSSNICGRSVMSHWLDGSTHGWISGLPMQDLMVALDNADSRMWYAHFFPPEGTASTFGAPEWVLRNYGRSPSFTLTDRGQ
jgi:hypothetical protein